jgi:hypothetical protein
LDIGSDDSHKLFPTPASPFVANGDLSLDGIIREIARQAAAFDNLIQTSNWSQCRGHAPSV